MDAYTQLNDYINLVRGSLTSRIDRYKNESLYETDDGFVLELGIPGVEKSSIDISVDSEVLTIKAKRRKAPNGKAVWPSYHGEEVTHQYTVGAKIDTQNISAEYVDGILAITLPLDKSGKNKIHVK